MYTFYEAVRSKKFGRTSTNMYLQYKWDVENFATHRYNVKTAKPMIDNNAPLTFTHLFVRPKKLQLELERYSMIQRNNRFLLERLATIHREGAWIDNKNYRQPQSLNTWKRQQEMIHLAHNNQIMLARLQDVNAQHNRTKLEDEFLMNQKYKANIQKFPSNWREVRKHLSRVRADIFKKCFDSKYQTESYRKSRKLALQKWTLEKEKHAAAKAEKLAQEAIETEELKKIVKEKRMKASKEYKMVLEKRLKSSDKWKSARDERLKQRAEKEIDKKKKEAEEKKQIQDRERKRRQMQKEELEKWRKVKEEERQKLEQKKRAEEKLRNELKREELRQKRRKQQAKQIRAEPKSSMVSTGFEPVLDGREYEFEEGKEPSALEAEEIISADLCSTKSVTDETLSNKESDLDRQAGINEETEEILSGEETLKAEPTNTIKEDQITQKTSTKDLTNEDSDRESLIQDQTDSGEEIPTTEVTSPEQDSLSKESDGDTSASEQTISDDKSSTTDETSSDEESLTTDQKSSDQESS